MTLHRWITISRQAALQTGEPPWSGSPLPGGLGAGRRACQKRKVLGPSSMGALEVGKILTPSQACQDRLRAMFVATRLNNVQILQELEKLTTLFEQAGIPVVALKGICFALTIYPDIGMRPMGDLDLLVPVSRLKDAVEIAHYSGYVKAMPEATPGLDELLNHAACLTKTRSPFTTLEIHHTLVGEESFRHAVPVDWFWTQTETMVSNAKSWEAAQVLMLTPTAQLLYACAHAMLQHGGRNASLRWMYDLDRLVRVYAERLDWELLLTQARRFEWGSAVSAALSQIASIFHTPVPPSIVDELASVDDSNTERVLEMQSLPGTHTLEEYQKFKALNGKGRIKLLLGLAVPGPAYMRWRYGIK